MSTSFFLFCFVSFFFYLSVFFLFFFVKQPSVVIGNYKLVWNFVSYCSMLHEKEMLCACVFTGTLHSDVQRKRSTATKWTILYDKLFVVVFKHLKTWKTLDLMQFCGLFVNLHNSDLFGYLEIMKGIFQVLASFFLSLSPKIEEQEKKVLQFSDVLDLFPG